MAFDWDNYSGDSGTRDVPLLLSIRGQSLVLAAMEYLDSRRNWLDVDDATWDEIEKAVAQAYDEVMERVIVDGTPVGTVAMYADYSPPMNWMTCEGQFLEIADYPDLYAAIGVNFNASPPSGQFQLPDTNNRFVRGNDFGALGDMGDTGGNETHTLTTAELPPHSHGIDSGNVAGNSTSFVTRSTGASPNTNNTKNAGSGASFNIMNPYIVMRYIIKVLP